MCGRHCEEQCVADTVLEGHCESEESERHSVKQSLCGRQCMRDSGPRDSRTHRREKTSNKEKAKEPKDGFHNPWNILEDELYQHFGW